MRQAEWMTCEGMKKTRARGEIERDERSAGEGAMQVEEGREI